eukprot:4430992-Pyramimonas_sp.AAC.1
MRGPLARSRLPPDAGLAALALSAEDVAALVLARPLRACRSPQDPRQRPRRAREDAGRAPSSIRFRQKRLSHNTNRERDVADLQHRTP